MQHRHINEATWSLEAIDSAIEYGDLPDWRDLFAAAQKDRELALRILHIARSHNVPGSSRLAEALVEELWPGLARRLGSERAS